MKTRIKVKEQKRIVQVHKLQDQLQELHRKKVKPLRKMSKTKLPTKVVHKPAVHVNQIVLTKASVKVIATNSARAIKAELNAVARVAANAEVRVTQAAQTVKLSLFKIKKDGLMIVFFFYRNSK